MRVFISADIEGVSGVVDAVQTTDGGPDYGRARALMTAEVNAAIEGALAAGATEVVVNDSHGSMRNILIEELSPEAKLITGAPKPLSMMEGIEPDFGAAFFTGYHARVGTRGVQSHTYSGKTVAGLTLNGQVYGECGLNAAVAGYFGVPVALVTGDSTVTAEAQAILPGVRTVAVKEHRGRVAARCLQPDKARRLIREGAEEAVHLAARGAVRSLAVEPPAVLEVRFFNTGMADMAELIPGVRRLDETRVSFTDDDLLTAFKAFRAMIYLAGAM
ncbi:MAG TPA: M55 family metallopeptidase [Bacillota bacterium]|jgi:D-amino peptidase